MLRLFSPIYCALLMTVSLWAAGCSSEDTPSTSGEASSTQEPGKSGAGPTSGPTKPPQAAASRTNQTAGATTSKSSGKTAQSPSVIPAQPVVKTSTATVSETVKTAQSPSVIPAQPVAKTSTATVSETVKTGSATSGSDLAILNDLSATTTMGFIGVVGIPEFFQVLDTELGKLMKDIPLPSLPEEMRTALDKTARTALIGFDIGNATGWNSIGIEIGGGLFVIVDAGVFKGSEPMPMLALKLKDRQKLTSFLAGKGLPPMTFSGKVGPSELGSVAGDEFLIGRRGAYTIILPNLSSPDGSTERAAFNAFLKGDASSLSASQVATTALNGGSGTTRLAAFGNTAGFNAKIDSLPKEEGQLVRFVADRFPGIGFVTRTGGASLKVVARGDAQSSLKKILRPATPPALSKYVPAKGWAASRLSVNLDTVFQGVSEFIPPSKFKVKMAVMSAPMMLAGIGLDWTQISGALDGHILMALSMDEMAKLIAQEGTPEKLVLVFGVKDEAKADKLLGTLIDMMKKQGERAPPVVEATIAGRPGYIVKAGPMSPAFARIGKAIIFGMSVADVERAVQISKGANLSQSAAGKSLDEHDACMAQAFDVRDYMKAVVSVLGQQMGGAEMKPVIDGMNEALNQYKKPANVQMGIRVDGGLEFRLDGLDKLLPLVGSVASKVIPQLMK